MSETLSDASTDPSSRQPDSSVPQPNDTKVPSERKGARFAPAVLTGLAAALSFFLPLGGAGLWAPYELSTANFSRRIAIHLHGATGLGASPSEELVPTLEELGKGQLPFTSVALGFQTFGLNDWAGRLPLALWALAGLIATYQLVKQLADRTTALYSAVALSTMPLYFLQARTLLGDSVILASVAAATSGLAVLTFGHPSRRTRFAWLGVTLLALVAGFTSRGILLGVACPTLGVGLAWLIQQLRGHRWSKTSNRATGVVSLSLGVIAMGVGSWALWWASDATAIELLGAKFEKSKTLPTHDSVLHQLGHGLFPWSAAAPFLLAVILLPSSQTSHQPTTRASSSTTRIELDPRALPVCLGCVFLVALLLHGMSLPRLGPVPCVATFAVAGWVGVGFRRLDTEAFRTRLLALGIAALFVVLARDLKDDSSQAMAAFAVGKLAAPGSFVTVADSIFRYAAPPCLLGICVWLGDFKGRRRPVTQKGHWLQNVTPSLSRPNGAAWCWLSRNTRGRMWRASLVGTATLLALAASILVDQYLIRVPVLSWLGPLRPLARLGFLALPLFFVAGALFFLLRDLFEALLSWLPWPRARLAWLSFAALGFVMSLAYYPALAKQLSPRGVFGKFNELAHPREPLAVLGSAAEVAPFYTDASVATPKNASSALAWLTRDSESRRWLVVPENNLAQLNSLYRRKSPTSANLPILFAQSSEVSLATGRLLAGETSLNPFDAWLHSKPPTPQHPLNVQLEKKLRCLGWSLTTPNGRPVAKAKTGRDYELRVHWKVLARIHKSWKAFIHIDGSGRRHNGDHDLLAGKYPMRYWNVGDYVTDAHPVRFERQFGGASYDVYFGLWSGKDRLKVVEGKHTENRIDGGKLAIR